MRPVEDRDFETVLASNNGNIVNYQVSVDSSLYVILITCEPTTTPTAGPPRCGRYIYRQNVQMRMLN